MKTIGIIGGMSWESSATYYRLINQQVRAARGATASAPIILWSFDFSEIEALQRTGDWAGLTARMIDAARRLEGTTRASSEAQRHALRPLGAVRPTVVLAAFAPSAELAEVRGKMAGYLKELGL